MKLIFLDVKFCLLIYVNFLHVYMCVHVCGLMHVCVCMCVKAIVMLGILPHYTASYMLK